MGVLLGSAVDVVCATYSSAWLIGKTVIVVRGELVVGRATSDDTVTFGGKVVVVMGESVVVVVVVAPVVATGVVERMVVAAIVVKAVVVVAGVVVTTGTSLLKSGVVAVKVRKRTWVSLWNVGLVGASVVKKNSDVVGGTAEVDLATPGPSMPLFGTNKCKSTNNPQNFVYKIQTF